MEPIPDSWPQTSRVAAAPLFPLPGFFLYPGTVVPLHIFEPRYKQMIEDMLDGPGRLVMGSVLEGHERELAGAPPVFPIGGLGEIGRHERLADGRFNILLVGLTRVCMHEVDSDRAYRKVEFEPLEELQVPEPRQRVLRAALQKAVLARCNEFLNLPAQMPASNLADLLIQRMELPRATIERLYAELDVEKRAEAALAEHARQPIPPPSQPKIAAPDSTSSSSPSSSTTNPPSNLSPPNATPNASPDSTPNSSPSDAVPNTPPDSDAPSDPRPSQS